jgi:type II secretory pathway pseudopilin PulG
MIELLCVIAIIGVLAALLLGPVSRALKNARDADWADKASYQLERVIESLKAHYEGQAVSERLTVQQLFDRGILDEYQRRFLTDRRVEYHAFVTADPDSMVVIRIDFPKSFFGDARVEQVRKGRLTPAEKPATKDKS